MVVDHFHDERTLAKQPHFMIMFAPTVFSFGSSIFLYPSSSPPTSCQLYATLTMLLRSSKTTGTTAHQECFRVLNLPVELRCMVYENIDFSTTHHDLNRVDAHMAERSWPVPLLSVANDSKIILVRPYVSIDILATCHIIQQEAAPILRRKMRSCKQQPLRYLERTIRLAL